MKNRALFLLFVGIPIYLLLTMTAHAATVFGPQEFTTGWWGGHFSVHNFTADASLEGQIAVTKSTPDKTYELGLVFINGEIIRLGDFLRGDGMVFGKTIQLNQNNYLIILFGGDRDASLSIEINQDALVVPPEITFSATPAVIISGENSTLAWATEYAETVTIEPGIGSVQVDGSLEVAPVETTEFFISATGPGGTTMASVTVTVTIPEPTVSITAAPATIELGNSSTLSWTSTYADSCTLEPGIGSVNCNSTISISPTETTNYTITATGLGGTTTASATITVTIPEPTTSITAAPTAIPGRPELTVQ